MATFTATKGNNNNTQNSYFVTTLRTARAIMVATLFSLLLNLTSCSPDSVNPDSVTETAYTASTRATAVIDSNSTLKSVATFPIGATPGSWITKKAKGYEVFKTQFDSKTVHAYMSIETSQGVFNFQELDFWAKWAETNPVRLHGHCLVFHTGAPEWMLQFKGNTSDFELMIKKHIQTIVGRQKGKIQGWDVFNEIFTSQGKIDQTPFRKLYTSDEAYLTFVKQCFKWAHEADPNALLFYNDFSMENSQAKLDAVVSMVEDFKKSGIPINGVGSQMHININTSDAGIRNSLLKLTATGLLIHISELDIAVNPTNDANLIINQQLLDTQRAKYKAVVVAYKQLVPTRLQYGITLWDFSDADSWIVAQKKKNDAPCIFDGSYNKKPAFYGLMDGAIN
ncbi:endo-1,4-beta-xylanase [Spirosoma rigui]|uniref:endo-1,4-beta-xylanase n=1 Tax=Spirosoma rigui TaxID=564064 RepID=UPI0009B01267|nr:endo-1,4-beta-xylanase [Spirosoma rigui]